MQLDRLIADVDANVVVGSLGETDIEVTSLTQDTREVKQGALFCCVRGETVDGHDLAARAVEQGAVALLVEKKLDLDVPQVTVTNSRAALAQFAAAINNRPAKALRIVGITGTNGKTTVAELTTYVMRHCSIFTETIGTLSGAYTSPPAPELQNILARHRDKGQQAVVIEVSSHALVQHRVDTIEFEVGVFTNLSREHLDYHGDMESYFDAKSMLFDSDRCRHAVVNTDDEWGRKLVDRLDIPFTTYSLEDVTDLHVGPNGSVFEWRGHHVELSLIGLFNVCNALAAAHTAEVMGLSTFDIAAGLNYAPPVRGRVESVNCGQPFSVIVDFAHTPDGLGNILAVAKTAAADNGGRVLVTFGCGGDRDQGKRPLMGAVAEKVAEIVVVTTDNPRHEDPEVIAAHVLDGMQKPDAVTVELDRARAIEIVIGQAQPGDVVVIAGKGHETTQQIGDVEHPFDDRERAKIALERLATDGAWS